MQIFIKMAFLMPSIEISLLPLRVEFSSV